MEVKEFDSTLGGTESLPFSMNSLKFAASRSIEIAAMTESIVRPSKTNLIFQSLPVHMRRRVMSHNAKRLPRRLREAHLEQMKKSGLPPRQTRPSRKHRRRPANLLDEYNRRQRRTTWLETHIWHAKRFHMIERWGHRLAYAPCDKAFRACYRASSAHCLIQDISYFTPIQITGPVEMIKDMFSVITCTGCGLGVCAKAFTTGKREGTVQLYKPHSYPFGYIGKINFIWTTLEGENPILWIFVHPSQAKEVETILTDFLQSNMEDEDFEIATKRRKVSTKYSESVKLKILSGAFNRFRLTGPNSHAILTSSLKCLENLENTKPEYWTSSVSTSTLCLKEKHDYWKSLLSLKSPSELPARLVIGLTVKDPRLSRPKVRTKATSVTTEKVNLNNLIEVPDFAPVSPLWDVAIHKKIKEHQLNNGQFIQHVTKTQLVPGEVNVNDPTFQTIPIVLIQRPGSQDSNYRKIGYGCGWDIILPPGYALQFWHTFIMFGARSGALRETESLAFELGECYLPPDSHAGQEEEKRLESELRERYFRLPPSKRVNYMKLAIPSPFICPWRLLLNEWTNIAVHNFFVLRDKKLLNTLQIHVNKKKDVPEVKNADSCLVPVYVQIIGKGHLKRNALICLPQLDDISAIGTLFEPRHEDPNEKLRKQLRKEHKKKIKQTRRTRAKQKKLGVAVSKKKTPKHVKREPSEYVKRMRELWVAGAGSAAGVRRSGARDVMGYVTRAGFSFTQAHSGGLGYVPLAALTVLLRAGRDTVLVRNNTATKYRLATIRIVENT